MFRNIPRIRRLALIIAVLAMLLPECPAAAHLDIERSDPADGAILETSPGVVKIWFEGELDSFESTIAVFDERQRQVDLDDASVSLDDRRLIQVSLPGDLLPGTYTVHWTAVDDEDAHPVQGEITFTIAGTTDGPGNPSLPVALGAGVVIAIFGAIYAVRRQGKE